MRCPNFIDSKRPEADLLRLKSQAFWLSFWAGNQARRRPRSPFNPGIDAKRAGAILLLMPKHMTQRMFHRLC